MANRQVLRLPGSETSHRQEQPAVVMNTSLFNTSFSTSTRHHSAKSKALVREDAADGALRNVRIGLWGYK